MTLQATDTWLARRDAWIGRVKQLVDQVEQWATAEGWAIHRDQKEIKDRMAGDFTVPLLRLRAPGGDAFLTPVALRIAGDGDGRVDLEAWPTLNRVRLIGKPDGGWEVITDSNIPLRQPWSREMFVQLVRDLQS
jgi:hypothetical protein